MLDRAGRFGASEASSPSWGCCVLPWDGWLPRFPGTPCFLRVPFFLMFSVNQDNPKQKRKRVLRQYLASEALESWHKSTSTELPQLPTPLSQRGWQHIHSVKGLGFRKPCINYGGFLNSCIRYHRLHCLWWCRVSFISTGLPDKCHTVDAETLAWPQLPHTTGVMIL